MQAQNVSLAARVDTAQQKRALWKPTRPDRPTEVNPWLAMIALMFGLFMALLDVTIMNVALANIQLKLHTNLTTVSWVLNAYNLGFAVLLVTMGRFADQFGRKRVYIFGMIIFSLGSLLCALSPSIGWLIGFRVIQSIGAAALNPVSLAIITHLFPANKRGAAIGVWGSVTGGGAALGPLIGGLLVQNVDWRWIFLVNLPFCLIGLIMVARFVPESKDPQSSRNIDLPGLLTLTATMFSLVLAIIQGNEWGWSSFPILGLFASALLSLILFIQIERRQAEPIVDFSLFRIKTFIGTNVTMFLMGIAVQGVFLILILYYIQALHFDTLHAAYATIPSPLGELVGAAICSRLSRYIGPKFTGIFGLGMLIAGLGLLFTLPLDATYHDTIWRAALMGTGIGFAFASFPAITLSEVPRPKLGVGSGVSDTFRQIGFTLGVAVLVSLLAGQTAQNTNSARATAITIVRTDTHLPAQVRSRLVLDLNNQTINTQQSIDSSLATQTKNASTEPVVQNELLSLNQRLDTEFAAATASSFKATWLFAISAAILALIAATLIRIPRVKYASPGRH
ncbi:MAG TPA: MFS transporter [Ktedonobacteraceae bacterium]|nr:MFS transporter [Ktedonobacteraceae bacterium]